MSGFPAQPARDALAVLAADRDLTVTDLARVLGVDRSTVYRLFTRNTLRYDAADHIAVALGRHPSELWPDWFRSNHLHERPRTGRPSTPAVRQPFPDQRTNSRRNSRRDAA